MTGQNKCTMYVLQCVSVHYRGVTHTHVMFRQHMLTKAQVNFK